MNIILTDTQKYTDLKKLVEASYTIKTEAEDVWKSIRWNLLTPDGSRIVDENLGMYTPFLETGKPLCHLDFYVDRDREDPFFEALELPYVSIPCSEFTMGYVSETKRHYRFFFVNPDVNGSDDFSFMNKLALKDTYIFTTYEKGKSSEIQNFGTVALYAKEHDNVRFVVHCLIDSDKQKIRYAQMLNVKEFVALEKNGKPLISFSATQFENKEKDLQKRFNARINRKLATNAELCEQMLQPGIWKWSDVIKSCAF